MQLVSPEASDTGDSFPKNICKYVFSIGVIPMLRFCGTLCERAVTIETITS